MMSITRRHQDPRQLPEDWPNGALNPDSDFFVPEELREHYHVDHDAEARRFGLDSDQREISTDLPSLDFDIVEPTCTPEAMERAGLNPRNREHRIRFLQAAAARLTKRDRDLHVHRWRLNQARAAVARAERHALAHAEQRRHRTCQVCGEYHPATGREDFRRPGDNPVNQPPRLTATVCPPCRELVERTMSEQHAAGTTASGKTRREVAAELVHAALADSDDRP